MPTTSSETKSARLEARTTRAQKELFEKAAALEGRSLTDFVIASVRNAALKVIQEHEAFRLGVRDSEVFVTALLSNATPGTKLKAAARRYQERTSA